jgi:hypothetical protein
LRKEPPCQEVTFQEDDVQKGVGVLVEAQKIEVVVDSDHVDVDNQMAFEVALMMSSGVVGIEGEFVEGHYEVVVPY